MSVRKTRGRTARPLGGAIIPAAVGVDIVCDVAVATGATSRTMARTTADPVADCAPSCRASCPTCNEMVAPSGMAMSSTGSVVTRARNQHCSSHSRHQLRMSHVLRKPSAATATIPPV